MAEALEVNEAAKVATLAALAALAALAGCEVAKLLFSFFLTPILFSKICLFFVDWALRSQQIHNNFLGVCFSLKSN